MAAQSELTKQGHALISLFLKTYKAKYKRDPMNFNRFRDKWGFQSMIEDVGIDRSKEIIVYFFSTNNYGHPVSYLFRNYDSINARITEMEEDDIRRKQMLKESEERVKQWREQNGK